MAGRKEIGGAIPLESWFHTEEYYAKYERDLVRVNSCRSGILCAIKDIEPKRIFLPYYNCPDVLEMIEKLGLDVCRYTLDSDMLPRIDRLKRDDCIIYTNYFGMASKAMKEKVIALCGTVIFDNAQAFYDEPVLDQYNVYSCRKFFGVPDGGYLIHKGISTMNLHSSTSYKGALYLLKALDVGQNEAYDQYKKNEERLNGNYAAMSALTQKLLRSIDYGKCAEKRRENFLWLDRALGGLNEMPAALPEDAVPYIYPFYYRDTALRSVLIENKIYVSRWWKHILNELPHDTVEYGLSQYLLPLPIDQRYDKEDMAYISETILGSIAKA